MERTGTSRSCPSGPARQVAGRHVVGQPDAVGGLVESVAGRGRAVGESSSAAIEQLQARLQELVDELFGDDDFNKPSDSLGRELADVMHGQSQELYSLGAY